MTQPQTPAEAITKAQTRATIRVTWHGPTNHHDQYLSVHRETLGLDPTPKFRAPWADNLNPTQNAAAAAQAFLDKYNPGALVSSPGLSWDRHTFWTWHHPEDIDQ